ncbi:DUF6932 family protein [Prosthecobacter dejongeii]|jgi:hypothetical protein|uniref:Uncharacterized protein n=1 Tax=Prosthecobacter dejongeii TaxID=48465 RepID=A0A7W8DNW1_9BACT|nr:hypothetical protein [Prosthecobacter dejongeii]MBB5036336.1 hypothetical protein [Prosthecobacter dejongeii]
MIPPHDQFGLLPPGLHWTADPNELAKRFAVGARRRRLFDGFIEGSYLLRLAGCRFVYLDGSFVTTKELPEDFDACWDPLGVQLEKLDPVFFDFNNFRQAQKARFGGEFFPSGAQAEGPARTFFEFFQINKDTGAPKGLVAFKLSSLQ